MATQPVAKIGEQEYLEHERNAEWPSEYLNGEVFPMDSASARHGLICTNITGCLILEPGKRGYLFYSTGRLRIEATGLYTYPDLMLVCGEPKYLDERGETVANPAIIFEILSRTTRDYDRGEKFDQYQTIPSLREYITVAQYKPQVQHRVRQPDSSWNLTAITSLEAHLQLVFIECKVPLSRIYKAVIFDEKLV